jgi:hypothetical protein
VNRKRSKSGSQVKEILVQIHRQTTMEQWIPQIIRRPQALALGIHIRGQNQAQRNKTKFNSSMLENGGRYE